MLVRDGIVAAVGKGLEAPDGAQVIEGSVVCAGFIDPWSSLGITSSALADSRTDGATRALDAFDFQGDSEQRMDALASGVTSVRVQIGRYSPLGGLGAVLRLDPDLPHTSAVVLEDASMSAAVGLSERGRRADVFDRLSAVDRLVSSLDGGRSYREDQLKHERELAAWQEEISEKEEELEKDFKKAKKKRDEEIEEAEEEGEEFEEKKYKEDKKPSPPRFDAEKEVLARVAYGEIPLVVNANRASELHDLLRQTARFDGLRLIIAGGVESLAVADHLAARRIPVLVWPAPLAKGLPDELDGHDLSLAAHLADEDVPVLIGSGLASGGSADLPLLAGLAVGHGLDREQAFAALTIGAARAFDVADRLGSVEPGKQADLLVLDGEPLVSTTRVQQVISHGRLVNTEAK